MDPSTSALSQADIAFLSSIFLRVSAGRLVTDCIHCGSTVALTICVSDENGNKGKPMARHPLCLFFRWFPQLASRLHLMAFLPASKNSPTPPSSQPLASSSTTQALLPPPLTQPPSKKQRKRGERCIGSFCARARALRCSREMCSKHCIDLGGCHFHGFDTPEEDVLIADNDAPFEFPLEQDVSNDVLENEELRLALNASLLELGLPLPGAADPMPSLHDLISTTPPSTSVASSLSAATTPPSTFVPEPSSILAPVASSSSAALHASTSKPPRITQQMDPIWTTDLHARARQEAEQQRVELRRKEMEREAKQRFVLHWYDSCPYYPQWQLADDPDLIALLGEDLRKMEVYEEHTNRWIPAGLSHTFSLKSGCNVFIRRYGVSRCRDFQELLNISRQGTRPRHLRFNMTGERDAVRTKLKCKDTILKVEGPVNTLTKAKRQREESCEVETSTPTRPRLAVDADFDSRRAISLSPTPPVNVDFDSRRTISLSPTPPVDVDFDSRCAISLSPTPPPLETQHGTRRCDWDDDLVEADFDSRRAISLSPTPPLSPNAPFSVSLTTSSSSSILTLSSDQSISMLLPASRTRVRSTRMSSQRHAHTATLVQVPLYDPNSKRQVWPHGMFTVDMTAGFHQMDNKILRATYQQEELFQHVFGVPFVKATYHQNRKAWQTTNLNVLAEHEAAGHTPAGLWSRYLAARRDALGEQSKKSGRAK
ncbi:uncharacterized protein EDB91DRAFT_1257907 [Suillus paluster]|uniref:uncharacterized protein n=1 Tax=Suillus paluster TaxID=48578 RepID=UPI001B88684A|nr:uncharacterized protein EDB91DRAFT_1257907 [Suillus paluster]KAG1719108.1 hypothetical protein EDB91DRAFT_1257907 [Suillus paluster]